MHSFITDIEWRQFKGACLLFLISNNNKIQRLLIQRLYKIKGYWRKVLLWVHLRNFIAVLLSSAENAVMRDRYEGRRIYDLIISAIRETKKIGYLRGVQDFLGL